jgi:rRNA maturation endonuclease Nob1
MWEISYGFLAWVGMGMTLSSQFVALSASKPEQSAATSVTTYYLVQQVGFMMGITLSKALLSREIERRLMAALRNEAGRSKVGIYTIPKVILLLTCC